MSPETLARFWAKVNKSGPIPTDASLGPCWVWTASTRNGYGAFAYLEDGRTVQERAHRLSFALAGNTLRNSSVRRATPYLQRMAAKKIVSGDDVVKMNPELMAR